MYMGRSRTSLGFIALLVVCLMGASMIFGVYIS